MKLFKGFLNAVLFGLGLLGVWGYILFLAMIPDRLSAYLGYPCKPDPKAIFCSYHPVAWLVFFVVSIGLTALIVFAVVKFDEHRKRASCTPG